jgi:hypothetical protein
LIAESVSQKPGGNDDQQHKHRLRNVFPSARRLANSLTPRCHPDRPEEDLADAESSTVAKPSPPKSFRDMDAAMLGSFVAENMRLQRQWRPGTKRSTSQIQEQPKLAAERS